METGTGSLEALREANRLRVVDALRREGSASRTDLVKLTGLSRTTITTLVGDLHARGLVIEDANGGDRGERPGRGRPALLVGAGPAGGGRRRRRLRPQPRAGRRGRPVLDRARRAPDRDRRQRRRR